MFSDEFIRDYSWNGNERNRFLVNLGDGQFVEAATPYGLDSLRDGRGLATADFDGDGDLDFIVNNYRALVHYFVNEAARGRWLQVRLRGRTSNRDAVGAVVRVLTGANTQMRVLGAGGGYASQDSKVLHFGLRDAERVDELIIEWPSGERQIFSGVEVDQRVAIEEGESTILVAEGRR